MLNAYGQVNIGDPLEKETLMGPLLNQGAVDSYLSAIEKVKNAGGEITDFSGNHGNLASVWAIEFQWELSTILD